MERKQVKITDFINGKVEYDKFGGQYFWIKDKYWLKDKDGKIQMLAELRGWGAIQNLFKDKKGYIDIPNAAKFQDELGDFIAEAINEKIERLKNGK